MIRLIVRTQDCGAAANVAGAKSEVWFTTFDIQHDQLEKLLLESTGYRRTEVIGAEPRHSVTPEAS